MSHNDRFQEMFDVLALLDRAYEHSQEYYEEYFPPGHKMINPATPLRLFIEAARQVVKDGPNES